MFAIVIYLVLCNVYLDHLKFCVVCINSGRYVCCSECTVVSNEDWIWALPILWGQGEYRTCVFLLWWCRWGVGRGLGPGSVV